ncbi:MAG: hypothetical protein M2R45_03769 [Verrucomicrobia subdivision 3 bacterium]|nr:hypothetical protein [Limisphaerales bacterium]
MLASSAVEQRAVVRANEQVLQHGVVRQQDVGRRLSHLITKYKLSRQPALGARRSVTPSVPGILRCLSDVLPERRFESRLRLAQFPADRTQPLTLIVRQRIHGVEDQGPHSWFFQLLIEVLAIELEQDWVEKTFGLATGGAGGDDDVPVVHVRGADGAFLMHI